MDLQLDGELDVVDETESVTYVRVLPAGETEHPVPRALRRAVSTAPPRQFAPGVTLAATDVVWYLPASALGTIVPAAGDRVVQGPAQWIVLAATRATLGTRWQLFCRPAR